jgi:hypothetical protein
VDTSLAEPSPFLISPNNTINWWILTYSITSSDKYTVIRFRIRRALESLQKGYSWTYDPACACTHGQSTDAFFRLENDHLFQKKKEGGGYFLCMVCLSINVAKEIWNCACSNRGQFNCSRRWRSLIMRNCSSVVLACSGYLTQGFDQM